MHAFWRRFPFSVSRGFPLRRPPWNPYKGMQERQETFEFATKPAVTKKGDGYVISFASKAACDATVAVVDTKGTVVRHLASGVLDLNAPAPFAQGITPRAPTCTRGPSASRPTATSTWG